MGIGGFKKLAERKPRGRPQRNAKDDRNRDTGKIHPIRIAALRHADKGGEQHDDENIVAGRPGQDQLRDALCSAIVLRPSAQPCAAQRPPGKRRRERRP